MSINRTKYPRTAHLPWSPGISDNDICGDNLAGFNERVVIITEKMDGENTTMYSNHIHARSVDSKHHPSRNWVKSLHAEIAHLIPRGWRLCGENLYAKHSVYYDKLRSYFYLFSIWNEENYCLSWSETVEWAELLGLEIPEVIYHGIWNERYTRDLIVDTDYVEGYVVRIASGFKYEHFSSHVAKWVRAKHVQTDQHWMHSDIIPNRLIEDKIQSD